MSSGDKLHSHTWHIINWMRLSCMCSKPTRALQAQRHISPRMTPLKIESISAIEEIPGLYISEYCHRPTRSPQT